jgi:hypothetical protein
VRFNHQSNHKNISKSTKFVIYKKKHGLYFYYFIEKDKFYTNLILNLKSINFNDGSILIGIWKDGSAWK